MTRFNIFNQIHKALRAIIVSFNNTPRPGLTISRRNLAAFMLDALEKNMYVRERPVISEK
jgi:hypothetical protein